MGSLAGAEQTAARRVGVDVETWRARREDVEAVCTLCHHARERARTATRGRAAA